ncbi:MAG: hypothetical protein ABSE61_01765 [Bradyrhizobium sp.]
MSDADRTRDEIDGAVDLVGLRLKQAGEIKGIGVFRLQCQRSPYPLFGDRKPSSLEMAQAGSMERSGRIVRRTAGAAAGAELLALHWMVSGQSPRKR